MKSRLISWLKLLTEVSPLPAWLTTLAVLAIWVAAASGFEPARRFWHDDAATILQGWLGSLAIWLGSKTVSKFRSGPDGVEVEKASSPSAT